MPACLHGCMVEFVKANWMVMTIVMMIVIVIMMMMMIAPAPCSGEVAAMAATDLG